MTDVEDRELEEIRRRKIEELLRASKADKLAPTPQISGPTVVDDRSFDTFIASNSAAIVDFWATWCAPCRMVAPVVEALSKELAGKVAFGKLDVDENWMTAQKYGVMSIPTLIVFRNGREYDRIIGALPAAELRSRIYNAAGVQH
ncbi:MAG: thioredoxin [Methanomassiliicoccales archaeon]